MTIKATTGRESIRVWLQLKNYKSIHIFLVHVTCVELVCQTKYGNSACDQRACTEIACLGAVCATAFCKNATHGAYQFMKMRATHCTQPVSENTDDSTHPRESGVIEQETNYQTNELSNVDIRSLK